MIKQTVTKNLIGIEDLLLGVGTVEQQRGPSGTDPVDITKINGAIFPYDGSTTLKVKFDTLEARMDNLPEVVDQDGNLLVGLIRTSQFNLNLEGRIWRLDLGGTAAMYYGTEFMYEYDKNNGNIIIPNDTNYQAADDLLRQEFQLADQDIITSINALSASLGTAAFEDSGNGPEQLVKLDSLGRLPAVDGGFLTNINDAFIGAIVMAGHIESDIDWLECNGQAVSRITYAALFSKINTVYGQGDNSTTFNLPDLRAMFVRGHDDGRAIDTGRVLGSTQDDAIKVHNHGSGSLATASAGTHTHTVPKQAGNPGANPGLLNDTGTNTNPSFAVNTGAAGAHTHTISGSTGDTGTTETRPKNVALKFYIRAK